MKNNIALKCVISILLLLLGCVGCGHTEVPEESTTGTSTTSESTTTESETTKIDLDGYVFSLINGSRAGVCYYTVENPTAEQQEVNDILRSLETEYNFTVEDKNVGYSDWYINTPFLTACAAGEKFADFVYCEQSGWGAAALKGYLKRLDIDEVKATGLDVTDGNVFNKNLVDAVRIDGEVYCFDICGEYRAAQIGQVFVFNKALVAGAGYPVEVIYQAVRDGVWTWDVFADICRAGSKVGEYTPNLMWAETMDWIFGVSRIDSYAAIPTMGGETVRYTDGKYVSGMGSMEFVSAYNHRLDLYYDVNVTYNARQFTTAGLAVFYAGRVLFGTFNEIGLTADGCAFEYGVVPYPTWSSTDGYKSVMTYCRTFCMQESNADWEKSCFVMGKIAEALGDPEAGVVALEKYVCDAESMKMIREYILPGLYVDPLTYSDEVMDVYTLLQNDITAGMSVIDATGKYADEFSKAVDEAFERFNK